MQTRMQPIGNAWAKLPRIVRDLAIELGKKIELEMRGADTELDRQVLDRAAVHERPPLPTHRGEYTGDRHAGTHRCGKLTVIEDDARWS